MSVTAEQFHAVRAAVTRAGNRFIELVSSARDPHVMATRHWSVADSAAHVESIARLYAIIAGPAGLPFPIPDIEEQVNATTVDTVAHLNDTVMKLFTERDLDFVLPMLREDIKQLLVNTAEMDPREPVSWLGSSHVPVIGVLAHLMNELHIHGRDIALAIGAPWIVAGRDAALFFEHFVAGVVRCGYGHLLDNDEPARERRIGVRFHTLYHEPVTLSLHNGLVTVGDGPVDVHLHYHPTTLNLMLFGRVSRLRAVATGKLRVSGRRPWLLPTFLRTVRLPS
jgi:hypothetical protein